jgi:hypothetical protein
LTDLAFSPFEIKTVKIGDNGTIAAMDLIETTGSNTAFVNGAVDSTGLRQS